MTALILTLALVVAACGGEGDGTVSEAGAAGGDEAASAAGELGSSALPNACPVEGCRIFINSAEAAGSEIALVFEANFTPDFERNHIHVFWDSQEPGAVSMDYLERGFTEQGKWHPTDDYPEHVTQADASVSSEFRQGSTTICVTAADTDHNVIDPGLFACRDVADLVS
jgi:hypothetical protein